MVLDSRWNVRRIAMTHGVIGLASLVSLVLFFIIGGPFGAVNDVGNAALGVLSGALAARFWALQDVARGALAASAAILGAVLTAVGSYLILSDRSGFFFAGLISSAGFALIGLWLISVNRWIRSKAAQKWPPLLPRLGVVTGAVMSLGLIGVPGILAGLDDMGAAPGWIHVGGLSWLGTYVLFPAWSLWVGRATGSAENRRTTSNDRHPAG